MAKAQTLRTHCPQGHEYDEANTTLSSGRRTCRTCKRERYHARRDPSPTLPERLWQRFVRDPSGCWLWTGAIGNHGYGVYGSRGTRALAHRLMYELLVGPIPEGLQVDHVWAKGCRHRHCVNPSHLEAVTGAENNRRSNSLSAVNARKTHCVHGHEFTPENTGRLPSGTRYCKECNRIKSRANHARKRASR